jgi:hypothetical protein
MAPAPAAMLVLRVTAALLKLMRAPTAIAAATRAIVTATAVAATAAAVAAIPTATRSAATLAATLAAAMAAAAAAAAPAPAVVVVAAVVMITVVAMALFPRDDRQQLLGHRLLGAAHRCGNDRRGGVVPARYQQGVCNAILAALGT